MLKSEIISNLRSIKKEIEDTINKLENSDSDSDKMRVLCCVDTGGYTDDSEEVNSFFLNIRGDEDGLEIGFEYEPSDNDEED